MLDRDKIAYEEWLFRHAENLIQIRRNKCRAKIIDETYANCDISRPYETKNNYIEGKIQCVLTYFDILDDLNNFDDENIEKIKSKCRKVEKLISKQQKKKLEGLDSVVTSQMSERNLAVYVKHKGYNTDYREISLNNLQNLLEEFERIEAENAKKLARRKSRMIVEPISAAVIQRENLIVMSVDNTVNGTPSQSKRQEGLTP